MCASYVTQLQSKQPPKWRKFANLVTLVLSRIAYNVGGINVMILKIFSPKNGLKNCPFRIKKLAI
jgi:hypothetical protein